MQTGFEQPNIRNRVNNA